MSRFLARVAKIKISGSVNEKMVENVFKRLTLASFLPIRGVVVHINSLGGSLTQAKNMSSILKNFSKEKNAPVYCVAEDECLGAANIILTAGTKCYANQMSVMGGFGFVWQNINYHKLAQKYQIKHQQIYANSTNLRYRHQQQIKPATVQFTQRQLESLTKDLIQFLHANRFQQMKKIQSAQQTMRSQVEGRPAVGPQAMIKCGLIDGIKNAWQIYRQQFRGIKTFTINKHEPYDFIRYGFSNCDDSSQLNEDMSQYFGDGKMK